MSGDFPRDQEWYPRECALCTREAALACDDPGCRARKLGEDYEDAALLAVAEARSAADTGERHSLDDVAREFGVDLGEVDRG